MGSEHTCNSKLFFDENNNVAKHTALVLLSKRVCLQCCQSWVHWGENVDSSDDDGVTALMHAVRGDHEDCAQSLLSSGATVNMRDYNGKTALNYAVRLGNVKIFQQLMDNKADINIQDKDGKTVLMHSCQSGMSQICDLLISHKADLNITDSKGKTALIYTAQNTSILCCCSLLGGSADVNIQDMDGMTALMHAARNRTELCSVLITGKPDLNLKDKQGMTALMHAATVFSLESCKLLLQKGADPKVEDNNGMTALMHVICKILRYFTIYSDKVTEALNVAELLINHGSDVILDSQDSCLLQSGSLLICGMTVRNLIKKGYKGLVRLLVCNGVVDKEFSSFPATEGAQMSTFECAVLCGRKDLISFFLDKWYISTHDLKYILQAAADRSECDEGNRECIGSAANINDVNVARYVVKEAACRPWTLLKLAFVASSSALGASPDRRKRIARARLPPKLQRMLRFQGDSL